MVRLVDDALVASRPAHVLLVVRSDYPGSVGGGSWTPSVESFPLILRRRRLRYFANSRCNSDYNPSLHLKLKTREAEVYPNSGTVVVLHTHHKRY